VKTAASPVPVEDRPADPDEVAAFDAAARRTRSSVDSSSAPTWGVPKQIRAELPAVEVFDAKTMLPEGLRGWIMDEANRMPCAPELIAAPVIVALGALIGALRYQAEGDGRLGDRPEPLGRGSCLAVREEVAGDLGGAAPP
jgi:hypothetical protein